MKILFMIASLEMGGAQRVFISLVNWFAGHGCDLQVSLSKKEGPLLSELNSNIKIHDLNRKSKWDFPKLVWRLTRIIREEKPDILVGFMFHSNMLSLLAKKFSRRKNLKVILTEHLSWKGTRNTGWINALLAKFFYKTTNKIVAVSKGVAQDLISFCKIKSNKVISIYNPVFIDDIRQKAKDLSLAVPREEYILFVGRLDEKQKGIKVLIDAFEHVGQNWDGNFCLIGEGPDKKEIESYIQKKKLAKRIFLLGEIKNPYPYIQQSKCLVLSSRYEGLGCVLLEAMSLGIPVVSTDCPHGPAEIIEHGYDGILVPVDDTRQLANELTKILNAPASRKSMGQNGIKKAERFSIDRTGAEYKKVFEEVLNV